MKLTDKDKLCENLRHELTDLQTQLDHLRRDKSQANEEITDITDKVDEVLRDFWLYFQFLLVVSHFFTLTLFVG